MNRSTRMIALTGLFVTLIAGVSYADPSWTTDLGVDFWSVPTLKARLQHENEWRDQLDARDDVVLQRIAVKNQIVGDLLARRKSLVQAAAEFKELNEDQPRYMEALREAYPSRSDEECFCRNVIAYVASAVQLRPARAKAEVARLEAELQAARDSNGLVHLAE
jgi:hypothetical protein